MEKDFRVCLVKASLLWSLAFLMLKGASSADEPKCEISCRLGDGPKDEETVDPDSITPSHCSIKNGRNISRNMTWKEVNDKITPKPGEQCLVLKRGNSEKRIYFASPLTVTRSGSPVLLFENHTSQTVKCTFKGRPRPQITWYKDGSSQKTFNHTEVVALLDNGIFQVNTTLHVQHREEFAGVYHCFGNNSLISGWSSSKEPESGIELLFKCLGLHIERSGPKDIAANVFSNVTLSCLVDKTVTALDDLLVTWNFKNQSDPLKTGGKYRIPALEPITSCRRAFKLEIINVTENDKGVYTCHQTCKDSGGDVCKDSAQFELKVHSPRQKEYSPPLTKNESKCEISCRLGDGPKDEETVDPDSITPSHCSIKNGGNISRNMTWKEVNDKITPKPGLQCLVLKRGNSEKRIYFASPLTVERWGSPVYLDKNHMSRNVKCVFKGRPRPQITWYKDGSNLTTFNHTEKVEKLKDNDRTFQVTTTLHVPGREEFAGIYKCFGNNSLSSGWSSSKEPKDGIELLMNSVSNSTKALGDTTSEAPAVLPTTEEPVAPQSVQAVKQSKHERWLTPVLTVSVGVFALLTSVVIFHCKKKGTYRGTERHDEDAEILL
ncbi:putative oxidoreductase PXDNL [Acropora palmata]|uniref:putative oxidoreductase PXDNL n=1 Tax=Acropora palmata TaxID=6131 RepID=UPI003D9FB421